MLVEPKEKNRGGESLFLSKDFPCSQRGNPQKYRDKLNCYASSSRPGHSFATQQGCTIASGDYSTPVSQRMRHEKVARAIDKVRLNGDPICLSTTTQLFSSPHSNLSFLPFCKTISPLATPCVIAKAQDKIRDGHDVRN